MTDNDNKQNSLEIPITSPSSPLVPLQIHDFVKDINVPIETKVNTNNPTITGGESSNTTTEPNTNTGFLGYFKSFFQRFSQSSNQQKKQEAINQSSFQKLFYSGDGQKEKEKEEQKEEAVKEEAVKEEEKEEAVKEEEEEDMVDITKIILTTTEDPDVVLRESLKGTKLYYFTERTDLPSQWV